MIATMIASWMDPMRAGQIPAFSGRLDETPVRKSTFSQGTPETRTFSSSAIRARMRIAIAARHAP